MLELLLNLVWVLIVTASLLVWRRLSCTNENCPRRPVTTLIALVCVLVLLFPVISATDDLHVAEFAIEDSGRKVLRHLLPDASSGVQGHTAFAPPVPVFCIASPLAQTVAAVHQQHPLLPESACRDSVSDRAPPALG